MDLAPRPLVTTFGFMLSDSSRSDAPRLRLTSAMRVRSSLDFARIYAANAKAGDGHLLVFAAPSSSPQTRFGLSVSRKHGGAVQRGRIKRLLRESFRLSQHDLPAGLDLVLIPRQGSGATLDDYRQSLLRLTGKLHRRLAGDER
jgi:ribonuclease P protein component